MEEEYGDYNFMNDTQVTSTQSASLSFLGVPLLQLVVSNSAVTLNTLVLTVGLLRIKGSYRHYLSNLAVIDLLFSIGSVLMVIDFNFSSLPVWLRDVHRILCSFTVPPMSVALVPISVDRYLKVCRHNSTKLKIKIPIPLVCIFVDFFPVMTLFTCKMCHVPDRITNSLYMVIIPVGSLLIVLACNVALFISISHHATVVASFENRRRINETSQLARATCIQAATPLVMQVPSLLGIFSIMGADLTESVVVWHLANLIWFLMLLNPLVDAIVTLVIVKTYRRAVRSLLLSLLPVTIHKDAVNRKDNTIRLSHARTASSLRMDSSKKYIEQNSACLSVHDRSLLHTELFEREESNEEIL